MFEFLLKKQKEQRKTSNDNPDLQKSVYNEEIANIDIERARTYKSFFSAIMDTCDGNTEKEKAFKDVICSCVLLEEYPNEKNSQILDNKLKIAEKYIDE